MSANLSDYNSAARMRGAMQTIAEEVLDYKYPQPRYATVTAIDLTNRRATVQYPDETATFTLPVGSIMPTNIGAVVRVAGRVGARYIDEVLDGNLTLRVARLTSTTEATLASTDHAWQIGLTSGLNLVADNDEIQARSNGAASALRLNPHGGDVVIGDGSATSILVVGNDAGLRDVSSPHVLALVSQTNTAIGNLRFGLAGPQINTDGNYLHLDATTGIYLDGSTHYFRDQVGTNQRAYIDNSGIFLEGNRVVQWNSHGGGWYMQDASWMRVVNNKGIYTAGTIRTADRFDFDGTGHKLSHSTDTDTSVYYWADGQIGLVGNGLGYVRTTSAGLQLGDLAQSKEGDTYATYFGKGSGGAWNFSHIICHNPNSGNTAIALHSTNVAPIIKCWYLAEAIEIRNNPDSAFAPILASAFTVNSTLREKVRVQRNVDVLSIVKQSEPIKFWPKVRPQALRPTESLLRRRAEHERKLAKWNGSKEVDRPTLEPGDNDDYESFDHDCDIDICDGSADDPCYVAMMDTLRYGMAAEDVYKYFPEAVWLTPDRKPGGIDIAQVATTAFTAVGELTRIVETLTERVRELEEMLGDRSLRAAS